ncbi:BamA/TamA family outer membrane protein [Tolypothrix sp. NIES-4075]|uniref:BamA/TamA family outer membrane protein n=1 Tax=Tolypothrix sp. NIES-4075 TaxID=2005459 RepID=UPI000B5CA2B8|nr:BamA/TamA family outer membrane protein [Tolypothrix sp. NIES-4075]
MRIQIVILIVGMLVSWSYQVRAESELKNDTNLSSIVETDIENMDEPLPTSLASVERAEVSEKIVKDIQIRFLNNKDKWVDEKGRLIEGRTQKDFIIDNLRLKPGQIFRNDLFQKDVERLRRLNSFDKVNFVLEDSDTSVNIVYYIRENKFPSWSFGGGDNGDVGLYGKVGYQDANINGLNEQLDTSVQVSGKDVQFDTSFISPYRRGEPSRLGYSFRAFRERDLSRTFNDEIKLSNGSTAREGRFGGSVAVLKSFDDWDAALGLNYTRISLRDRDYNLARVDRLGSPLSVSGTGIDDLVTVSFAISKDERDRRSNPTKGSLLTLSTEQAIPIGLGKIASNRLLANYILYVPVSWIGSNGSTENTEMIALNLQAGTNIGEFPPANAFDLGGLNSVRGYGGGRVASARSYGLAAVEYRFPILRTVGGVLFADFGSDFGSSKTVLGEPGILRGKPGSGFGYGLGLRVKSPFGLIRGDLGISDQGEVKFEVTTGQRF